MKKYIVVAVGLAVQIGFAAISSGAAAVTYAYGAGGVDAGYTLELFNGPTFERRVVRDAYRPEQVVAVSNFVNGTADGGETYARDAKGRIVERVENVERVEQLGYDSASRLTTVATGDVTIATYAYDAFDRRVRKTTAEETTTYFYDGWNLVREEISRSGSVLDVVEYFWGKDISGSRPRRCAWQPASRARALPALIPDGTLSLTPTTPRSKSATSCSAQPLLCRPNGCFRAFRGSVGGGGSV